MTTSTQLHSQTVKENFYKMFKFVVDELKAFLPNENLEFIRKNSPEHLHSIINWNTLENRLIYRAKNPYRHFESLIISSYISDTSDILRILEKIVDVIEVDFTIAIDFDSVFCTSDKDRPFKFEFASRNTRINKVIKIIDKKSAQALVDEFRTDHSVLLNRHFERHQNVLRFSTSGFRPYCLLSMKIYINTI